MTKIFHNKVLISIFIFLFLTPQILTTFSGHNLIETFITLLKRSHFPDCTLLFYQHDTDLSDPESGDNNFENVLPSVITQSGVVAYYSLKYNLNRTGVNFRFPLPPVTSYNRNAPFCKLGVITVKSREHLSEDDLAGIRR
jgi:hypothetical protein